MALIHLNVITLLEPFGCGALHGIFGYLLHICQGSAILRLIKPPDHTEWKLDSNIYELITQALGAPSIDLFASWLNFHTKPYIAWHPDPGAFAIDAFSVDWGKHHFYAFPTFNLIDRVLQKVEADQASGLLIVPQWTTQPWFPVLMRLLVEEPLILPRGKKELQLPYNPSTYIHTYIHILYLSSKFIE